MKKWQENRNYRRLKNDMGAVTTHIITIDGQDIEVTEEVFLAYSQAERRERYIAEEVEPGKVLSLDKLLEDHVPLESLGVEPEQSAEAELEEQEALAERDQMKQTLLLALISLNNEDRDLITALFFDGVSTREYARKKEVSQRAVIKRRDRILRDMKKFFEKFSD